MEQTAVKKLEVKDLKKATKSALVMDDVTFTVHAGEIFALVGEPESCKTLLSKIVVKLVKKTNGEVVVGGKLGASLEQQKFYPNKSAYKILEQHAYLHRRPISHNRIINTLNLVGLKDKRHALIESFDASAIARLKIAIAIYASPEILILDEPFANLSPVEAHTIRVIIKTIAENEKAAVFITAQNAADVEEICDTIGIIDEGLMVSIKSYNQHIRDDAPYEKMRVQTQTPNYAAKVIEQDLGFTTHLCGEWVVVDTPPANAQKVADALIALGIKILSVERVNRSLQEQYYEIVSARRRNRRGAI